LPFGTVFQVGHLPEQGVNMRLAEFILQRMDAIVAEWEVFASTQVPAAEGMTPLALRDHAQQILEAVAKDLTTTQTREEALVKSQGRTPKVTGAPKTAAQTHAVLRAGSGFNINQLVAEYRALRASVLQLWFDAEPLDERRVQDIIRFNEAIDQAVAESVGHFHAQVERARALFLGMLGHDMRSPLETIVMTASYLTALNAGEKVSLAAARLIRSGTSMQALLDDLVDFNRTQLGLGLKVVPCDIDLASVVNDEVEQWRGAHPEVGIDLEATGDIRGHWDGARLQQVLRNLLSNAISYGSPNTPVRVALYGEERDIRLEVTNSGPTIDPSTLRQIFDPLARGSAASDRHDTRGSLGLGLFIVRSIAEAHGGDVEVRSGGGETTFVVRLRRNGGASPLSGAAAV
jgi:signal transduction histidine kinase